MFSADVAARIEEELARGELARREGFAGRARVSARRAAGVAIREYLRLAGIPQPGPSAIDLLAYLRDQPETAAWITPQVRRLAENLLAQVDESFSLPESINLLADARTLARILEEQSAGHY